VFALGLVTLFASEYVLPEDLYPWLGVASGVMVVAIGLAVMRSRFRRWRAHRARAAGHRHHHAHSDAPDGPITMRGLLALGVSGGLVPCPSALVVLIAAISQHRVGLGMALIVAFSLGLAATLTAVGLAVLYGGRAVARLRPERRLFGGRLVGVLPAASAILIVLAGTLITVRALPELGL
jgi:nickel/cobalt exporter